MYACNEALLIDKLKEHNIHITQNRLAIFKQLTESKTALSVSLIIKQSDIPLDRISVYRSLIFFLGKGIVEIIPNNKGNAAYILANASNKSQRNSDNKQAYFFCTSCKLTESILQRVNVPRELLLKYQVNKSCLILEGLCNNCKGGAT